MNYIVTKRKHYFESISKFNYLTIEDFLSIVLPEKIAVDTETTGLSYINDDIFCIQIGTNEDNFIIDLYGDFDEKIDIHLIFDKIKNNTLVLHNSLFDLKFFYKNNFYPDKIKDSLLASQLLYNGDAFVRHSFKDCMERELNILYDKTDQKNINKIKLSQLSTITYSFNDVDKLLELESTLENKLIDVGSKEVYDLHCNHIKALAYVEMCGLPLCKFSWRKKMNNDEKSKKEFEKIITEYIFDNLPKFRDNQLGLFDNNKKIKILLSSSLQMIQVFKELKINVLNDEEKESIKEDVISRTKHEFVDLWLKYQEHSHRCTTFGENILKQLKEDNRIYTEFKPILDTGRIASRKGCINFLNFPSDADTRNCFKSNKGFKIIVSDYEGQENVTTADISGDIVMIKSCTEGLDLHCEFARYIYPELKDFSDEYIKKNHKKERNNSKSPRFALAFGGNAYTLSKNLNVSIEEGQRLENLYKQLHQGVFKSGEVIFKESIKNGYIQSTAGFRLKLPYYKEYLENEKLINSFSSEDWESYKKGKSQFLDNTLTKTKDYNFYLKNKEVLSNYYKRKGAYMRLCMNNPVQQKAAMQTKYATYLLFKKIKDNGHLFKCRISNVIHDEIVLECKEDLCDIYKKELEDAMITGGNYFLNNPVLNMKAEANINISWGLAK